MDNKQVIYSPMTKSMENKRNNELSVCLNDLWKIPETERKKAVKLIHKILSKLLNNLSNSKKYGNLNRSKICDKLSECEAALQLLDTAGFKESEDGKRLIWKHSDQTLKLVNDAYCALQRKLFDEQNEINPNTTKHVVLNVGILGDWQVGRQSLMVRYIENKFDEDALRVNTMEKIINLRNVDVTISVWLKNNDAIHANLYPFIYDTFSMLTCIRSTKCIILAFDLLNITSLHSLIRHYKEARRENKTFLPFVVGTKYDLYKEMDKEYKLRITKYARSFAERMRAPLIFCSSLTGNNVHSIFKLIAKQCKYDLYAKIEPKHDTLNEAICEWPLEWPQTREEMKAEINCIVHGYIRAIQREYKWKHIMPVYDFSNIILLFYANIVIGDNNKDYKLKSRMHKKKEWNRRKLEKKKRRKLKKEKRRKQRNSSSSDSP